MRIAGGGSGAANLVVGDDSGHEAALFGVLQQRLEHRAVALAAHGGVGLRKHAIVRFRAGDNCRHAGGRVRDPTGGRRGVHQPDVGHLVNEQSLGFAGLNPGNGEHTDTAGISEEQDNVFGLALPGGSGNGNQDCDSGDSLHR